MTSGPGEKKKRKTRSDKKRDMRPTISVNLSECLNRISYITDTPIKDVAETFCQVALISTPIILSFQPYFRRDYWSSARVMYPGCYDNPEYPVIRRPGRTRVTLRLKQPDYAKIEQLAFALSVTPHRAAALLLEKALSEPTIVDAYIGRRVRSVLDPGRMRELREVFRFVNGVQPANEKISFVSFISRIYESARATGREMGDHLRSKIVQWLDEENGG